MQPSAGHILVVKACHPRLVSPVEFPANQPCIRRRRQTFGDLEERDQRFFDTIGREWKALIEPLEGLQPGEFAWLNVHRGSNWWSPWIVVAHDDGRFPLLAMFDAILGHVRHTREQVRLSDNRWCDEIAFETNTMRWKLPYDTFHEGCCHPRWKLYQPYLSSRPQRVELARLLSLGIDPCGLEPDDSETHLTVPRAWFPDHREPRANSNQIDPPFDL